MRFHEGIVILSLRYHIGIILYDILRTDIQCQLIIQEVSCIACGKVIAVVAVIW